MQGITFTECANHLSAQVSELPDYQSSRKVSATGSDRGSGKGNEIKRIRGGGADVGKRKGIHMPDGSVWTGFYSDWNQLSKEDRQTVMDTRIKNKGKGGKRQKSDSGSGNKGKLRDIRAQVLSELKRTLASIQAKRGAPDDDADDESDAPDNAGDSFGGRQKKKQKNE